MNILVTGARGMVAEAVKREFKNDELMLTDIDTLDVRSYENVIGSMDTLETVPDYILHLAAETDLEKCQADPAAAYHTNTIGTINMVKLARLLEIPIVYMSTAGVFHGALNKDYTEMDIPAPLNHYGRSKYYGEMAVAAYPKHYIFRMSWAFGGGPLLDKKFVNKLYQQIVLAPKTLYAVNDKFGSPTYTRDVAKTIRNYLYWNAPYGTYHVAGKGGASRFDVAKAIVEIMKANIEVYAVDSDYFGKNYSCPRATYETLGSVKDMGKQNAMRDWRESLEEYIKEYYL